MTDARKELNEFLELLINQDAPRMSSKQDEHLRSLMQKVGLRT